MDRHLRARGNPAWDVRQIRNLLGDIVREEVLAAAARKTKFDQKPEVQSSVRQLLARSYEAEGIGRRLREVSVDEKAIADYYAAHAADFAVPPRIRVAVISMEFSTKWPPEKQQEQMKRAQAAREEAARLPSDMRSFGDVAVRYSMDQSNRYRGGEIGWVSRTDANPALEKEVAEAVFSLRHPGEITPVVSAAGGLYLARLMDLSPGSQRPLEQVRDAITAHLAEEKRNDIRRAFSRDTEKLVSASIDEKMLQTLAEELAARLKRSPAEQSRPTLPEQQ